MGAKLIFSCQKVLTFVQKNRLRKLFLCMYICILYEIVTFLLDLKFLNGSLTTIFDLSQKT